MPKIIDSVFLFSNWNQLNYLQKCCRLISRLTGRKCALKHKSSIFLKIKNNQAFINCQEKSMLSGEYPKPSNRVLELVYVYFSPFLLYKGIIKLYMFLFRSAQAIEKLIKHKIWPVYFAMAIIIQLTALHSTILVHTKYTVAQK